MDTGKCGQEYEAIESCASSNVSNLSLLLVLEKNMPYAGMNRLTKFHQILPVLSNP